MKVTAVKPGTTCQKQILVNRSGKGPCGDIAVVNVDGIPLCQTHLPESVRSQSIPKYQRSKGQMPKQGRGAGLGEVTDRTALS